jgi:hypothetical protein
MLMMALVCTIAAVGVYGQAKQDVKTKLDRIEGTVQGVNKDKSEIMVRQTGSSNTVWTIGYSPETKFTYRNAPSSLDEVKETRRVICLGKFGANNKMEAARIDVRSGK